MIAAHRNDVDVHKSVGDETNSWAASTGAERVMAKKKKKKNENEKQWADQLIHSVGGELTIVIVFAPTCVCVRVFA